MKEKLEVIELIINKIGDTLWVLTGTTSLSLQGVKVEAKDIDILSDEQGAKYIDKQLEKYRISKFDYSSTEIFRSYFGIYEINNIKIEVMGDLQYHLGNGEWSDLENIKYKIKYIEVNSFCIPVFSLLDELDAYKRLGRTDKVKLIEEALKK